MNSKQKTLISKKTNKSKKTGLMQDKKRQTAEGWRRKRIVKHKN